MNAYSLDWSNIGSNYQVFSGRTDSIGMKKKYLFQTKKGQNTDRNVCTKAEKSKICNRKILMHIFGTSILLYFICMLTEVHCPERQEGQKRARTFQTPEIEGYLPGGRKRQIQNQQEEKNPYQSIPELPHIILTDQQMQGDPIHLFTNLESTFKEFGAVKITVSQNWKCPFQERFVDKGITTRIQYLSKLKHGKAFEQNVEAYSFHSYQTYALNLERNYKFKTQPRGKTIESKKESEYWSLVTKPECLSTIILDEKNNFKVEYAADLASTKYGSGFPIRFNPKTSDDKFIYETNLFNLNNIMKSPNSVLSMSLERKQKVSGITHPWVYMGSLFSTFCWHVEDLWVNSLNYNHKGGVKTWYVVPGSHKQVFDNYIKKKYCLGAHKQTLLERITFMVDPLELIKEGIPVFKTYQRPRDYVCTFFKAYHCGFSQGYNLGEAVNFLSPLSISIMMEAEKQKRNAIKKYPSVIPIDWIVYENYLKMDNFSLNKEKIQQAYTLMIKEEVKEIEEIKKLFNVNKFLVFPGSKRYDKLLCASCKEYLYLRCYERTNKKRYCFEHLKKEEVGGANITIVLRSPNLDRRLIFEMFDKVPVEQELELDKRKGERNLGSKTILKPKQK